MNIFSKFFYLMIILFIGFTLIFLTFSSEKYYNDNNIKYELPKIGLSEIFNEDNESILIDQINITDKIFSINKNYTKKINNKTNKINVWTWIYLFHLNDISKEYTIEWNWFELKNIWPWMYFINSININKILVFSFNNKIDLILKNIKDKIETINLILYPHTYFIFNPSKNVYLSKESDLLKISQVFKLWYFNKKIFNEEKKLEDTYINLLSLKKNENKNTIKEILYFIINDYNKSKKNFITYKNSSTKLFPWENYIKQYKEFFLNNEKKKIYYKNLILKNIKYLSNSTKEDSEIINFIVNSMKDLKNIDQESYNEMLNIINFYNRNILLTEKETIIPEINFMNLISTINNNKIHIKSNSSLELKNNFFKYDFISKEFFYNNISIFINKLLSETKLKNIEIKTDYLLFFLENILISDFSSQSNINTDTKNLITIFDNYVRISNNFYKNSNDSIKITWLYTNASIINNFLNIIRLNLFEKERNKSLTLKRKNINLINNEDLQKLKLNIDNLLVFFNKNKSLLNPENKNKDKDTILFYTDSINKVYEYFLALTNFEEYELKFDSGKKSLLNVDTISEWNTDENNLSTEKAKDYIKQFKWIMSYDYNVEIKNYNYCNNPKNIIIDKTEKEIGEENIETEKNFYCYKINNLNINWTIISFLLFPFTSNKIEEIIIKKNWKENNINKSYKLNEVEEKMKVLYKNANDVSTKNKYDFKNFFINNFLENEYINAPITKKSDITNNIIQENSVIRIFKRNKLLWEKWDFSILKGFLNLKYNDIIVEKNDNNLDYSISLSWIIKSNNIVENNRKTEYNLDINSNYIFNTHSFNWIKLRYKNIKSQEKNSYYLFGNYINLIWDFHINNFIEDINLLLIKINHITRIINEVKYATNIEKWEEINYIKSSWDIIFKTNYKDKIIFIKLNNWKITSFKYNDKEFLKVSTKYTNIKNILPHINK